MIENLKKFDCFPKVFDDFRVKTTSGAVVSLISIVLMVTLFVLEFSYYFSTETVDHLYVNTTRYGKLKVTFDFSFPEISCKLLSLDAVDETGIPQSNITATIYKHKISSSGKDMGLAREEHKIGDAMLDEKQLVENLNVNDKVSEEELKCGNCYGAGSPGQCCNTCNEVKTAYARVGWKFHPQGIRQCVRELTVDTLKSQYADEGGCQIYGTLLLNQVSGHFHIAPHKQLKENGLKSGLVDFMELIAFAFSQFNITHTINTLSFGNQHPGLVNPLDGQQRNVQHTHGMYQYYIKIVPTKYRKANGKVIESNQYAVTEHLRPLAPGSGRGLPGIYFYYDISPIQALKEEKRGINGRFSRFLTNVCAIVGGSFTVLGLVDSLVNAFIKNLSNSILN